jgi:hypothetical protein
MPRTRNRSKAVRNVSDATPEYEVPTEGANGVSAKVIDWPDTDRAPTIVEIAGERFTRGSEQDRTRYAARFACMPSSQQVAELEAEQERRSRSR